LILFGAGAAKTLLPDLPQVQVDSQLLMALFLPPILYTSTEHVT
jgi:NhaP-type Na+/H+ or K+/H+ antiporter